VSRRRPMSVGAGQSLWTIPPTTANLVEGDVWIERAALPGSIVNMGGAMVYGGGDHIFVLRHNNYDPAQMLRYSINGNIWSTMANAPDIAYFGSTVYGGGDFIYAFPGLLWNGAHWEAGTAFWRYSITGNSWTTMASVGSVGAGNSLAFDGGNFIYATMASNWFQRYSIAGNSWAGMAALPFNASSGTTIAFGDANFIYSFAGNNTTAFWRYSIVSNSWASMAGLPVSVGQGASLTSTGGDFLYALPGSSNTVWRYSISQNRWMSIASLATGCGADITYTGPASNRFLFALRGSGTNFFQLPLQPAQNLSRTSWQPWMN